MADPAGTIADVLVHRLHEHGVRRIFGYPGGQITPIYDALYRQAGIRHILARDEQAAGFMADGYARASGRPGVFLAVCGPGVLNAATPLATAFTDSIPVLLLSGQIPNPAQGLRSGYYHENDQLSVCRTITKLQVRADGETLVRDLDRAMAALTQGRPGPVLLEVPLPVLRAQAISQATPHVPSAMRPSAPHPRDIEILVRLVAEWRRPLLIAGGGVVSGDAPALFVELAERLGAPMLHTLNGKSAVPGDHPLAVGLPWCRATSDVTNMTQFFSPLCTAADGLLALGCRFSQACTGTWSLELPGSLVQVDIDPQEIGRHYPVQLGVAADAAETLRALLAQLPAGARKPWAPAPPKRELWRLPGIDLLGPLRRLLPRDAILVADITRLSYILLADFPVYVPRTFLHPAGYVAMGYGLPAALGAKAAWPERAVVAVVGDGCFLMSGMELATAVQENLPIIVILINDCSLSLIKALQERRYEGRFLGVDLRNPDFGVFAQAFGVRSWRVESDAAFESALQAALDTRETALIEVRLR
jgi:acetolactate synthase-1/2/3 large subunit